jgi:hypothetical protein
MPIIDINGERFLFNDGENSNGYVTIGSLDAAKEYYLEQDLEEAILRFWNDFSNGDIRCTRDAMAQWVEYLNDEIDAGRGYTKELKARAEEARVRILDGTYTPEDAEINARDFELRQGLPGSHQVHTATLLMPESDYEVRDLLEMAHCPYDERAIDRIVLQQRISDVFQGGLHRLTTDSIANTKTFELKDGVRVIIDPELLATHYVRMGVGDSKLKRGYGSEPTHFTESRRYQLIGFGNVLQQITGRNLTFSGFNNKYFLESRGDNVHRFGHNWGSDNRDPIDYSETKPVSDKTDTMTRRVKLVTDCSVEDVLAALDGVKVLAVDGEQKALAISSDGALNYKAPGYDVLFGADGLEVKAGDDVFLTLDTRKNVRPYLSVQEDSSHAYAFQDESGNVVKYVVDAVDPSYVKGYRESFAGNSRVQRPNTVIDIGVADDASKTAVYQTVMSMVKGLRSQGSGKEFHCLYTSEDAQAEVLHLERGLTLTEKAVDAFAALKIRLKDLIKDDSGSADIRWASFGLSNLLYSRA